MKPCVKILHSTISQGSLNKTILFDTSPGFKIKLLFILTTDTLISLTNGVFLCVFALHLFDIEGCNDPVLWILWKEEITFKMSHPWPGSVFLKRVFSLSLSLAVCGECHHLSLLIDCVSHLSVERRSGLVRFSSRRLMHNIQSAFINAVWSVLALAWVLLW